MKARTPAARLLLTCVTFLILVAPAALAQPVEFALDPSASEARFVIGEVLLGRETTAVGATPAVAGSVTVDSEAGAVAFGLFEVDVTTLRTDDRQRDGQIRNRILQTNQLGNGAVTLV